MVLHVTQCCIRLVVSLALVVLAGHVSAQQNEQPQEPLDILLQAAREYEFAPAADDKRLKLPPA